MFELDIENANKVYVSWSGEEIRSSGEADGIIQISGLYGAKLGLKDGDDVSTLRKHAYEICSFVRKPVFGVSDKVRHF